MLLFLKPSGKRQMCAVNGVGVFFFALERVSDTMYSCVEEELSLFHMECEPAGLIEAVNGVSETIILPTWHVEKLFITELNF